MLNRDTIVLSVWIIVVGGVFAYLWRKGYLMRFSNYLQETKEELKKCTWPSVDELKGSTVVILVVILLLGGFTVGADFFITLLVRNVML